MVEPCYNLKADNRIDMFCKLNLMMESGQTTLLYNQSKRG